MEVPVYEGRERDALSMMRVFSGPSHPDLARGICAHLGVPLSPLLRQRFSDDCLYIQLGETVRNHDVFVVQSISAPTSDHLVELFMMLDIARSAGARSVHAIIPYYSYARSDKKDAPRISITARLLADLIVHSGAQHVMTMTLHSPQVHGFFSVPTDHLTALPCFVDHFRGRDLRSTVVVSPDIGHAKRASKLATALGGLPMTAGNKVRVSDTEVVMRDWVGTRPNGVEHALIFDDEIANGGTMFEAIRALKDEGVRRFTVACTHGIFSGQAIERFAAMPEIEEIVTTDTVPIPAEKRLSKLTVLSVAGIFGEAIRCNALGQSVGQLFAFWPEEEPVQPGLGQAE
ncbi:MAG TPA: ribose-phosphate pyrophosphokinase [Anaerolineae bacterium]|nr:ribose-phosphate pyrophosphokinase [Anaerolineae bacterium]HPL30185.1 ribose-phosphate pyrophosphokinase [Anaerolineae bacterium]